MKTRGQEAAPALSALHVEVTRTEAEATSE